MVSGERSVVSIHRCIRANYCTNDEKNLEAVHEEKPEEKPKGSELSFCKVQCIGRVGSPPKEVETKMGHTFVSFRIGCGNDSETKWHTVNINNPGLASLVLNRMHVGDRVYVGGKLSYTDGELYNKNYRIYASEAYVLNHSRKYWEEQERRSHDDESENDESRTDAMTSSYNDKH
ncbi:uncharacterized protein LOC132752202 isoform X2 [Ruditapes philippinarum]|nr:uncharacterized protein LOC132752202 isoform X2 [Ruditapes philippinarum]